MSRVSKDCLVWHISVHRKDGYQTSFSNSGNQNSQSSANPQDGLFRNCFGSAFVKYMPLQSGFHPDG